MEKSRSHHDLSSGSHPSGKTHSIKAFNNPLATAKIEVAYSVNMNKSSFQSAAGDIEIFSCNIDPKDQKLAVGCGDGTIRAYDLNSTANHWKVNTLPGMSTQQDLVSLK